VLLIALGFLLFLTEVWVTAYGMLTIGGVLALTVGAMILFSGSNTGLRVDPKLIFTVAALVTAFVVLVVGSVMRSRRQPSISGKGGLIGAVGFATTDLDPYGLVIVHGERWKARTEGERIGAGQRVVVTEIEGLELTVESYGAEILPLPKEGPLLDEGEGTETPVALPPGREQQSDTAS
ncbi:MAG: rane-bound protease, partial [Dehalococcoidia bacterium]|nr:rane-bound protease [Dehalococcoidia bacterium]